MNTNCTPLRQRRLRWWLAACAVLFFYAHSEGRSLENRTQTSVSNNVNVLTTGLVSLHYIDKLWTTSHTLDSATGSQPDLVYEYRIAELNRRSPFPYRFHPLVLKYIKIYSIERREQVQQMLGLAELYFPIFREELDKYQLPLELVYLSVSTKSVGGIKKWRSRIVAVQDQYGGDVRSPR